MWADSGQHPTALCESQGSCTVQKYRSLRGLPGSQIRGFLAATPVNTFEFKRLFFFKGVCM